MELVPLLCLLSLWVGCVTAQEIKSVNVPEGDDALLPCILNLGQSINKFDWRKDNGEQEKQEVFLYKSGSYFGKDLDGQDKQFTDRVVFFQHELKLGNASIIIKNTRLEDNGTYTCGLVEPHRPVHVRLNVGGVLTIRNVTGAARVPYIRTIRDKITWRLLECTAHGDPEPEVEWRNSAGEVLAKHNPKSEDGRSYVELKLNVSKSDNYTCVATQWNIYHQLNYTTEVSIPDVVAVSEGDDAILPCSLDSSKNIQSQEFFWRKDDKQAFFYNRGRVEENEQFTGRLSHFQHELKFGNASIKIHNTQKTDGGRYSCHFRHIQKSSVILRIVEQPTGMVITAPALIAIVISLLIVGILIGLTLANLRQLQRRCLNGQTPVPNMSMSHTDSN